MTRRSTPTDARGAPKEAIPGNDGFDESVVKGETHRKAKNI